MKQLLQTSVLPELDDESRIERRHWGEIGSDESSSEESEEEEEEEEGPAETGFVTPGTTEGLVLVFFIFPFFFCVVRQSPVGIGFFCTLSI